MAKKREPIAPTADKPARRGSRPADSRHGLNSERAASPNGNGQLVLAWHDMAAGVLLRRPRPRVAAAGLTIEGPTPLPGEYQPGSGGFRYWSTADALVRSVAVWRVAVDRSWHWHHLGPLPVRLAPGAQDLATYDRRGMVLRGTDASTPACRMVGHAVLDALRPDLWDAAAPEVAAFHHAFADITVVLAALDLAERRAVLLQGGIDGLADALPALLDGAMPCSFTRTLLDMLAILARVAASGRGRSDDAALCLACAKTAHLLATAVRRVAVVPNLLAQMTSELSIAAAEEEGPLVSLCLRDLFARSMLLPRSPVTDGFDPYEADDGTELLPGNLRPLPWLAVDAAFLGLDRPLLLQPACQVPLLGVAANGTGEDPPSPMAAARDFVARLFALGRVEPAPAGRRGRRGRPDATHVLSDEGRAYRLCRLRYVSSSAVDQALSVQPASGSMG